MAHTIVIGAGQAGAALVARLRAKGEEGEITLIGEEPVPPYQRPPLSKAYLMGEMEMPRLFLRPEAFYADHDIALRTGMRVERIDPAAKTVTLADGEVLTYDRLALTTGSHPRRLPEAIGGDLPGVLTMRSLADADEMRPYLTPGNALLVIGGGYIGLEAAAVAAKSGLKVTLLEAAARILGRVAAPETAAWFRDLHRSHGVEILEDTALRTLLGEDHVTGALLADGREIPCDVAIAGIGIAPATELAEAAGLTIDNGIATDARGRTSDPAIWAAGDCASLPYRGQRIRLESVQNAIDQAEAVADSMMGADQDYIPKPWFWSDQYDVKLQIAGLNTGYDRVVTRKGEGEAISFWYYCGDRLLAVDAMNDPRAYMTGKRLIEAGRSPDPALVADPETALKALLAA
ncbi:pyridine nucleotide-disulfide oxidoreductase [Pseudooceanicola nanhaiensis]|jgi:3-phenylpropionate/trans-cinnamate dioxygenase ferredoxin reductase subunit|uniref:Pyridine nucleotide-disulfide oxidoreductase n=1 Tax=Pseudooceanicola nanhaiensis TaxID=375761 RepID=A0A917T1C5_9RHOB|nr:FAD-dependent oxidoreductase [Pseudooceanicola nanhaiensis]GGM05450.1 pyridine nucleotide-disulfide oxidoreductase [Pseudooceanicola nanhaiensis]